MAQRIPTERRYSDLKKKIFDIAMRQMQESGYESLTIRSICSKAGISNGMFYKIYDSKEDLLSFYYEEIQNEYDDHVRNELNGLPFPDQLIEFYRWILSFTENLGVDFCRSFFTSRNRRAV